MALLHDGDGCRVTLAARLGRGGEGEVFAVEGQPDVAAKLLQATRRAGKSDKVRAMVERPPAGAYDTIEGFPVLTWPRTPLYADDSRRESAFLGYAMTRVKPGDFVPFYQITTAARRKDLGGRPITWDRLVLLGMRLCHVVRTLHRFGYAVGDLNDRNVLVSRRLTPLLMDTDSFEVPRDGRGHFPCLVGDQLYWPPDLLDVDLAKHTGSRESSDRYALGVLLFQLFMDGLRPYQARGSAVDGLETLADKTRAGHYPWAAPQRGILEPPASAPDYQALPKSIRQAFERCFIESHRKPNKRPSADDWYEVLAKVRAAGFKPCAAEGRHVYATGLRACPWCADPNDPFDPAPRRARHPSPAKSVVVLPIALAKRAVKTGKPPQRALSARPAPPKPARPLVRPKTVKPAPQAIARRRGPKARATRGGPKRRVKARPRQHWPVKARWLAGLTSAVLATYVWMAS